MTDTFHVTCPDCDWEYDGDGFIGTALRVFAHEWTCHDH